MSLNPDQKKERVAEYAALLKKSQGIVMAEYGGLRQPGMDALRAKVREAQGELEVVKNTLAIKALKEVGLPVPGNDLTKSTIVGFGLADLVGVAKAFVDASKDSEFVKIKGGLMGSKALSAEDVKTLASLPPLPVVRGRLAGVLKASAGKLVGTISAPARNVAGVLKAYSEKPAAA